MELQQALADIGEIRMQMSRTRQFCGYRAGTTLLTGLAAAGAAIWQSSRPAEHPVVGMEFVTLWVSVALGCVAIVGLEMTVRWQRSASSLQRNLTLAALEQLLPPLMVGGLVTLAAYMWAAQLLVLLPGLWQIFFGLGLIASRRLLAGALFFVGVFYVLCGVLNLIMAQNGGGFSAWGMGLPFAAGQAASAVILFWTQERRHAA